MCVLYISVSGIPVVKVVADSIVFIVSVDNTWETL